jgi:hypothetical protein
MSQTPTQEMQDKLSQVKVRMDGFIERTVVVAAKLTSQTRIAR